VQAQVSKTDKYYKLAAKITFLLFIFFCLFGTSLPFRTKIEDVEDISGSNIVNQIVYTSLFLMSFVILLSKRKELFKIITEEKFLTIFLLWCTASIYWSDYSFTSFKRLFQIYCVITVASAFLLYWKSEEDMLRTIKLVLYPYLFISIVSVFIIPGAKDPSFHTWRALTPHKNVLGQVGVICTVLSYMILKIEKKLSAKSVAVIMFIISVLLTLGSLSSTSIILLFLIGTFYALFYSDELFSPLGIGRTVSTLTVIVVVGLVTLIILTQPDMLAVFTDIFGKDTSFSGRTDLWTYMMSEISKHPIIGAGYQGFWVVDNNALLALYKIFVWLPNQSHNGYIDIWNDLGIIGLILFVILIINYFVNLLKLNKTHTWKAFIFISLISNWQEATFFRPGQTLSDFIIISYLVLFFELHWQAVQKNNRKYY